MLTTPILPDWIRHPSVHGYSSAHELCPDETRLYGTESLYGDWDGTVLLLAKDFAPSAFVRARIEAGDPDPYRHQPALRTNKRLQRFAEPLRNRGLLYGSALANLLRNDDRFSGSLPNRREAIAYGTEVTRFAVDRMPGLKWIMCLGQEAWDCACGALHVAGDWCEHRDAGNTLDRLIGGFHPSARVSRERMTRPWDLLSRCR